MVYTRALGGQASAPPRWDRAVVEAVWKKGTPVVGADPRELRKDACTAWIRKADFGNAHSEFGWTVAHITPVERGGGDETDNLQPMQIENAAAHGRGPGDCPVRARGERNVRR